MSLTSDQIVNSLIAYYKSQGIDLVYVLGDPVFQAMKLDQKIEAIKNNAKALAEGSKQDGFNRADTQSILSGAARGALTGLFTVPLAAATFLPASRFPTTGSRLKALAVGGAALGLIGGGITGAISQGMRNERERDARNALVSQLHRTARDNSYQNAVVSLSKAKHLASPDHGLRDTILQTIANRVDKHIEETALGEHARGVYQHAYYQFSPEESPL